MRREELTPSRLQPGAVRTMGRFVIGATSGLATAARGLTAAQADFAAAAQSIARTDSVSPEAALVDAKLAEARIHATAQVVRTIDDMLGTFVDTVA